MEFKTTKQVANEWGITTRRVQILCNENRVHGAVKLSGVWLIPKNATQPIKQKTGPKNK